MAARAHPGRPTRISRSPPSSPAGSRQRSRRHARQPVEFAKSVRTLAELNCKVLLEIGPQPVLTAAALRAWPDPATAPRAIASLRRNTADHRQITEALADAYVAGHLPEFGALRRSGARKLDLPTVTRAGLMLNFVDPQGIPRLLGTIESVWTEGEEHRWAGGVEGGVVATSGFGLLARLGVAEVPRESGLSSLSGGAGLIFPGFRLDYAYQRRNAFGEPVHRLGLRLSP